ncbi:MAG: type II toxin-antitoxin system VapC family toxin, partial [Chloroflexota bacterium]|nr:type II toxin-antitoxin system VapC family toxin [Chloroflexota bacterium]
YIAEQEYVWITNLCDPAQEHELYLSQAALGEVVATICRKERERIITKVERDGIIDAFRQDSQNAYHILLVTTGTYTSAGNLCRSHILRAYDAVHLACTLSLRDKTLITRAPPPIFVSADVGLLKVALEEGLNVENPNNYL